MRDAGSELPLVIGLGNEARGDDGSGLAVARRLRTRAVCEVRVAECSGDVARLLDLWDEATTAFVVDAIRSGRSPGTVVRLEGQEVSDAALLRPVHSSHGLSVAHAVRLGASLGRLPGRLIFFGIEASSTEPGEGLSPSVAAAVDEVVGRIAGELAPEATGPTLHPGAPRA